jgi:hypothetical protein
VNLASALIKRVLDEGDFDTWSNLRKHYLPAEYHSLFTLIDKHCEKQHSLPTFEELKLGIRDAQTRAKLFAIEVIEVDADPSVLLDYLKNEFTQREILTQLENYIDRSIAFETAEESIDHLHNIITDVETKVDVRDPAETMERITLFESDEELSRYITLGLNAEYDAAFQFSPRDLILIGGKRGAGKSVTCANMAVTVKNSGRTALYFTIEMDSRNILQRCCSIDTGLPFGRLRSKNLSVGEWEVVAKWWADRRTHGDFHYKAYLVHRDFDKLHNDLAREALVPNQIDVIYDPGLTLSKIQSETDKRVSRNDNIGIIIVDYINKVRKSTVTTKPFDWTEQIEVAVGLKEKIAQEYDIPVLSPYQIDATGEARFAKGILDAADAAFTMDTHDKSDNCITFNCTKMRNAEERGFTSVVDWASLKIGPESAASPKEKTEEAKKKNKETASDEDVPF